MLESSRKELREEEKINKTGEEAREKQQTRYTHMTYGKAELIERDYKCFLSYRANNALDVTEKRGVQ